MEIRGYSIVMLRKKCLPESRGFKTEKAAAKDEARKLGLSNGTGVAYVVVPATLTLYLPEGS